MSMNLRTQWEYKIVVINVREQNGSYLNAQGAAGWELISVVEDRYAIFKRVMLSGSSDETFIR